jgi:IclR family KDG regulon transcriptional repressor
MTLQARGIGSDDDADLTSVPEIAGAQLLARGLQIIFALRQAPLSTAQLAELLELPVSNIYRMVQQLELCGMIERLANGDLVLGFRLLDLGRAVQERVDHDLAPRAIPAMQELTTQTGETTLLTVAVGLQAACVLTVPSPRPIRLAFEPGRMLPLYRAASGRILLAWLRPRLIEQVLDEMQPYINENGSQVTAASLRQILPQIREDGYCITRSETDAGATGIAAPLLTNGGRLIGGLTIAGPSDRLHESRIPSLVAAVRASATEIETQYARVNRRRKI